MHYGCITWPEPRKTTISHSKVCQLIAVRNTFPRYRDHKNVLMFFLHFLIIIEIITLFHLALLMQLKGIVSVLHEDEEDEILSPNVVAIPSHQIHLHPAFSRRNKPSTCPGT